MIDAERVLDKAISPKHIQPETMVVLDADKTLAPEDTGLSFWSKIINRGQWLSGATDDPLRLLFNSPLGYSYTAFRQATLMYEEVANDEEFESICQEVASEVSMHPEFISPLQVPAGQKHVGAVVVTCGLRRVWEKVLEEEGLSSRVKVIGGGRISDVIVVTAEVKGMLVDRLQKHHQLYVWAFGDIPLDLDMLHKADQAIIVVGEEESRSKTMDDALLEAIDDARLKARQTLLPDSASPRLDLTKLFPVRINEQEFVASIIAHHNRSAEPLVRHATDTGAAKLLMTGMRDAAISGPALREVHRRAGFYLAAEFLLDVIGIEEYPIPHVQGLNTTGYRLRHEQQTLIEALMRGGEPMAFGVNDALSLAAFLHAKHPKDITSQHLHGQHTLILVDSVVNSGKSVGQFVQHIRSLHATIRIVVVAGVIQSGFLAKSNIAQAQWCHGNIQFVALRISENKFTGSGTTDTGNRLFNTTHLP